LHTHPLLLSASSPLLSSLLVMEPSLLPPAMQVGKEVPLESTLPLPETELGDVPSSKTPHVSKATLQTLSERHWKGATTTSRPALLPSWLKMAAHYHKSLQAEKCK
jgi:hypothetical protein